MAEYNIDSVSRLMNEELETPTKKEKDKTGAGRGKKNPFPPKKTIKVKTPKKDNPFADKKKKGKENPFADKKAKEKKNPFAEKKNPFAESLDKLFNLLESDDNKRLTPNEEYEQYLKRGGSSETAQQTVEIDRADRERRRQARMAETGRGFGDRNAVWRDAENKRLEPHIETLKNLGEQILLIQPKSNPKGTLNLLKQLGACVKQLEANSHKFNTSKLKEVINKFGNLAQTYSYVSENPPHKIEQLMKQDPKNQAHYQKMLDYANKNLPLLSEYTRYKPTFEKHFNDFISNHGM